METTDEESSSTGHPETTVDSRKVSPSVRVTLQTPVNSACTAVISACIASDLGLFDGVMLVHTPVPPPSPPTPPPSPPPQPLSPQHAPADAENTSALANISTGCFVLGVSDDVEPDTSRLSPGQFESTRLSQARNDAADVDVGNAEITAAQAEFTVGHLFLTNITPSNRPRSLAIQAEITAVQAEFTAAQAEVTGRVHQNRPRSLRPRSRKAEITSIVG
ncbi:hypothetical protein LSAT2_013767 [Lamellibrachia satsuma]|nr:hypothetical protein LSAT2_013767 [Lamellibrachia satsuma]